ncbi:MAG: hypothetical protein E7179_02770 [Erysipelotrichaceae bacterium]|jgi:hypothetical protein|nr:hypothetical protein [Erysipelotrichaceae bacterium]
MNKKKILFSVAVASTIALTGVVLFANGGLKSSSVFATNGAVWHHYPAVAPTEATHGSKEFWASSINGCATHTFDDPGVDECVDHDFSTYDSFATLTCDDDRYVPSGNERLGITPMFSTENKTVTYGLYPQKNVDDSSLVSALNALTTPESNGWYLYDGEYYAKLSATPYSADSFTSKFDNGTTIVKKTTYWFKCEPIVWNVLSNSNGKCYVLSSVLLDVHRYYDSQSSRTIDGKTVYANNYKYSDIHTWLNSDFFDSAFALGNSHIQTTTVNNGASTTNSESNPYKCDNTQDNVFLPSYKNYINSSYGFSDSTSSTNTRYCRTTDWARARGAWYETSSSYLYNGHYWTRSPRSDHSYSAWYVKYDGCLDEVRRFVDTAFVSVRPAIKIA